MDQLRKSGFMGRDTLQIEFVGSFWAIQGQIACLGDIRISVDKIVRVVQVAPDPHVQTTMYAYNASVGGEGNFLRYDNQHQEWLYPGHKDPHHRHRLDWKTGAEQPGSPDWVGEGGWPTLGEFIREVESWYWANRDEIPNPEQMAQSLRGE